MLACRVFSRTIKWARKIEDFLVSFEPQLEVMLDSALENDTWIRQSTIADKFGENGNQTWVSRGVFKPVLVTVDLGSALQTWEELVARSDENNATIGDVELADDQKQCS